MGKEARHNEGVYLTLCLRQSGISQIHSIKVLNLATVDAPGVIYPSAWFIDNHYCAILGAIGSCVYVPCGYGYHIGVGSDVVCSTLIGSGRASVRGTGNG